MNIFESLGVRPVINAQATLTRLGGSLIPPEVLDAMVDDGLARWKLPEAVVRHAGPLPMTATGKVQRRALDEDVEPVWRRAPDER